MKIEISNKLIGVLKKRVEESNEFKDVRAYINYILEQVVNRLKKSNESGMGEDEVYSKKDEKKIKERLRALGYMD